MKMHSEEINGQIRQRGRDVPAVSIGLPVYEGENYLRSMVDSILAQTFGDFEVIISDNASTDRTVAICEEYARNDERIHFYRQPRNTGVAENLNFVFRKARARYFCWAAHDDVLHPRFLERSVAVMDKDPTLVLAFPRIRQIDELGHVTGEWLWSPTELRMHSDDPTVRFRDLISTHHGCGPLFGLIRTEALRKTRLNGKYSNSDRNLLVELGLLGRWHFIYEELLDRRRHPRDSLRLYPNARDRMIFYDPDWDGSLAFPTWRLLREYVLSVSRAPLSFGGKLTCYFYCGDWAVQKWRILANEVRVLPSMVRAKLRRHPV